MQNPATTGSDEADKVRSSSPSTPAPSGSNAPLVIVSERGRHSDESRRIVRAQAARASAAQSRVTRARNRGERESSTREGPAVSEPAEPGQSLKSSAIEETGSPTAEFARKPLTLWISRVLNTSVANLVEDARVLQAISPSSSARVSSPTGSGGAITAFGGILGSSSSTGDPRPQLPHAVPPGITQFQQRIQISESIVTLTGRTSFFDFDSPGVEERLHRLLFDLIVGYTAGSTHQQVSMSGHAIQEYLRIACICLTIFQGQRASSAVFAYQDRYERGLEAAWAETMLLDQAALKEAKAAEVALWAIFIISVTTGASIDTFLPLLHGLLQDLQLNNWQQVRGTLLDFIFPVSFLDEPCRAFYNSVRRRQIDSA